MLNVTPRVRVPATASPGEVIEIRTTITHPMHTGFTFDTDGELQARHIINRFVCRFNDDTVIDMTVAPGVAADPYIAFDAAVPESGTFAFEWHDDDGSVYTATAAIEVA